MRSGVPAAPGCWDIGAAGLETLVNAWTSAVCGGGGAAAGLLVRARAVSRPPHGVVYAVGWKRHWRMKTNRGCGNCSVVNDDGF